MRDRARVWLCDLDAVREPDTWGFVLSANERARAERLRSALLRRRFVARCMLVRHVLGPLVGVSPQALAFETAANGKPRLLPPAVHFNLSHSENMLALAAAPDRQVGVDIEVVRPAEDMLAVAEAQFTAAELDWLRALPPEQQPPAFYRLWTAMEAKSKLSGQGIASAPDAAPPLASLHPLQFRLGQTEVIGALAIGK